MRLILATLLASVMMSGCVGIISGHEYSSKDMIVMYKVVKGGVTTFMTREQIEALKLDKVDVVVTDSYKVIKGNDAPSQ